MNYQKIYDDFILNRKSNNHQINEEYYENHHIIPRCLGGNDVPDNIIKLTYDDHFFAHLLLHKINPHHLGLLYAVNMMKDRQSVKNRKEYSWLKKNIKKMMPELVRNGWARKYGFKNYLEQSQQVWDTFIYGYKTSECSEIFGITENNIRQSLKFYAKIYDKSHILKSKFFEYKSKQSKIIRRNVNPEQEAYRIYKIKIASYTNRRDISGENNPGIFWQSEKKYPRTCPYCKMTKIDSSAFRRWHFDNCRQK